MEVVEGSVGFLEVWTRPDWKTNVAFPTPEFPLPGKEGDDAQLLVKSMYLTLLSSLLWLPFGLKDQHSEMEVN